MPTKTFLPRCLLLSLGCIGLFGCATTPVVEGGDKKPPAAPQPSAPLPADIDFLLTQVSDLQNPPKSFLALQDFGAVYTQETGGALKKVPPFDLLCQAKLDADVNALSDLFNRKQSQNINLKELNERLQLLNVDGNSYFRAIHTIEQQRFLDASVGLDSKQVPVKATAGWSGADDYLKVYAVVAPYTVGAKQALSKCIKESLNSAKITLEQQQMSAQKMVVGALALLRLQKAKSEGGARTGTKWFGVNVVAGAATGSFAYAQYGSAPSLRAPTLEAALLLRETDKPQSQELVSPQESLERFANGIETFALIGWSLTPLTAQ